VNPRLATRHQVRYVEIYCPQLSPKRMESFECV